jgi:hypothetical protein
MAAATFSDALRAAEQLARDAMPDRADKIDAAVTLVKAGKVFQRGDQHTWEVASTSHPGTVHVVNGACDCADFTYRGGPCRHQMAVLLSRKVLKLMQPAPAPQNVVTPAHAGAAPQHHAPLPEARASVNAHFTIAGKTVQVTLRGTDEVEVLERMAQLIARYPDAPSTTPFHAAGPSRTTPPAETPTCPTHGVMKQSTKGTGWFCPNRLDDGSWCTSKGR